MKKALLLLFSLLLIVGCTEEVTDNSLLEKDKQDFANHLDSFKVRFYKYFKISIRASAATDVEVEGFDAFQANEEALNRLLIKHETEGLSMLDYLAIYKNYKGMTAFIQTTDEDIFPTLTEAFPRRDHTKTYPPLLTGTAKIKKQNLEHLVLSAAVLGVRDLGKEIALYECSKTKPELLPASEIKGLMHFFRGFLFFEKGFYYLSEAEMTSNIALINDHPNIPFPLSQQIFTGGYPLANRNSGRIGMHSLNHLFRGIDRLMMERDIDKERALQDFELFLADSKKLGVNNEIVWSVETYLYLNQEKPEKAIASLKKLRSSHLLSAAEKASIDQSIQYLEKRESGSLLNSAYDKFFLSKIAVKYTWAMLAKVDWEKLLKDENVPYTDELFQSINTFKDIAQNVEKYATGETMKDAGKDLQEGAGKLWDKAKGLMEE